VGNKSPAPQFYVLKGRGIRPQEIKLKKTPLELSDTSLKTADMREEKELQHLKNLYPDEFAELYEEALASQKVDFGNFGKRAAQATALLKLKGKYGIVK
jgi:hypothetical protein